MGMTFIPRKGRLWIYSTVGAVAGILGVYYFFRSNGTVPSEHQVESGDVPYWLQTTVFSVTFAICTFAFIAEASPKKSKTDELARDRLRSAEQNLVDVLSGRAKVSDTTTSNDVEKPANIENDVEKPRDIEDIEGQDTTAVAYGGKEDLLALSALWNLTNSRLEVYHNIATGQAKASFRTAQVAIGVGFFLLAGFMLLSLHVHSATTAITVGALGAVSAALAGYIGKTFVRSQESAATHLRTYFEQPLEFSRYLAAERLMSSYQDLSQEQRVALLKIIISAMAAAPPSKK